ncbi:MAG: 4a-hydroxytetrahydrobiopterin dehydratase [Planctomycetes bacterium]|jgi:4a-hydroxytetrahydrobiopterin dehydratase|nr:4a-hydroxytetrahydrobiopterin dehydratase [Planctomycetota bacterium]
MELADKQCIPCRGGVPRLRGGPLEALHRQLGEGWRVIDEHHLVRDFEFKNFGDALAFVNRVGEMAEEQGHHPDIYLAWGKVRIEIWTHKIDGLTESDFVFAARSDTRLQSDSGK